MKRDDRKGLTWEQQVEYSKVRKLGRMLNVLFKVRRKHIQEIRDEPIKTAEELTNES